MVNSSQGVNTFLAYHFGPKYNKCKKIQNFGHKYNLPKQWQSTILRTKTNGSRARLQNGKVLGTHFAQIKFSLLDFKWSLSTHIQNVKWYTTNDMSTFRYRVKTLFEILDPKSYLHKKKIWRNYLIKNQDLSFHGEKEWVFDKNSNMVLF